MSNGIIATIATLPAIYDQSVENAFYGVDINVIALNVVA